MQQIVGDACSYMKKTETACRQLFRALEHYNRMLKNINWPILISDIKPESDLVSITEKWYQENHLEIKTSLSRQKEYNAEFISQATIAGAILQIAYMGIRLHISPQPIPPEFTNIIPPNHEAAHFCIGNKIRGVPKGLIIYAGRVQYNHLNDPQLRKIPNSVFEMLASNHGWPVQNIKDPAFDLASHQLENYAANILYILDWKSYSEYKTDMTKLLGIDC